MAQMSGLCPQDKQQTIGGLPVREGVMEEGLGCDGMGSKQKGLCFPMWRAFSLYFIP